MTEPNWKREYLNLPSLPPAKLWFDEGEPGKATLEQIVSNKLFYNEPITKVECNAILESIYYYNQLNIALKRFDFSSVTEDNVEEFLLYISYAYNYRNYSA